MKDIVERLAYSREIAAERAVQLKEAETKLQASPLWRQWELASGDLKAAKSNVAQDEEDARRVAMEIFIETDDRAPHPAIKIKDFTVLDYEDADAFDYAREHLPKALKLDERTFEKAAKILELDFVVIRQEPRATIARDLSGYLPED